MGIDVRQAENKVIKTVHKSDGHGDVLYIDFKDSTQLVVWGFDAPDRLQIVLWNPDTEEILDDHRLPNCKQYTDRVFKILANRTPPVLYPAPFMAFHRTEYIPG